MSRGFDNWKSYSKADQAGRKLQADKIVKKKHKWGAKRTVYAGINFRSKLESDFAKYLDLMKKAGEVKEWGYETEECRFDLSGEITFDTGRVKRFKQTYTIDFVVHWKDGTTEFIETKGPEPKGWRKNVWDRFRLLYPEVNARIVKYVPKIG